MPDKHLDHVCSAFLILKSMKEIELSKQSKKNRGKYVALVDDEDYEYLNQFNWYANIQRNSIYAGRNQKINGKVKSIIMHREIMGNNGDLFIDHIKGNGLNNQKSNLRFCTNQQNLRNSRPKTGGNSKYKGVSWNNSSKSFVAKIKIGEKNTYIKSSKDEIVCAKAYDTKAKEIFGEFAWLNFT